VRTSSVQGKRAGKVITRNTEYELGEPHARSGMTNEQLLQQLTEI
jgi:hypothetical protein